MCHARYDGCCRIVVDQNTCTNYDVNVELRHNRTVKGQTDGRTDRRMEKRAPMSQSQEVREIFRTRFDGCLVL